MTTRTKKQSAGRAHGQRYLKGYYCPKNIPAGRLLCHNPVKPVSMTQAHGDYGFRVFTYPDGDLPENFSECKCGWSGLKHYKAFRAPAAGSPLDLELKENRRLIIKSQVSQAYRERRDGNVTLN